MELHEEILALIPLDTQIPRQDVLQWMASKDLRVLAALYRLTREAYWRITPGLRKRTQFDCVVVGRGTWSQERTIASCLGYSFVCRCRQITDCR